MILAEQAFALKPLTLALWPMLMCFEYELTCLSGPACQNAKQNLEHQRSYFVCSWGTHRQPCWLLPWLCQPCVIQTSGAGSYHGKVTAFWQHVRPSAASLAFITGSRLPFDSLPVLADFHILGLD